MVWTISPYLFTSHMDSNHMSVFLIQYKCLLLMSYALLKQLVLILTKVDLGFDTDSRVIKSNSKSLCKFQFLYLTS